MSWLGAILLLALACYDGGFGDPDGDGDSVSDVEDRCPRSPAGFEVDVAGCSPPEIALGRGRDALVALGERCRIGTLWAVREVLELRPTESLRDYLRGSLEDCGARAGVRIVDPEAPRLQLPENPGRGVVRFANFVRAPAGAPEYRAVRWIDELTSVSGTGYLLTHQLLVLVWSDDTGLELPEHIARRSGSFLAAILREQRADPLFSDLFAERLAILLRYGQPDREESETWIRTLVDAQNQQGLWEPGAGPGFEFDGVRGAGTQPTSHTTSLALLALAGFLE